MPRGLLVWELILALCEAPHEAEVFVTFNGDDGYPIFSVDSSFGRTDLTFDDGGKFEKDANRLADIRTKLEDFYEEHFSPDVPVAPGTIHEEIKTTLEKLFPVLADDEIPF